MKAAATFRIAARAPKRNKMRSLLAMPGIGIGVGVGAVIATVGIGIGLGVAEILCRFPGWPAEVPILVLLASVVFSAAAGIFFGLCPALKAAALDPIDALRYE